VVSACGGVTRNPNVDESPNRVLTPCSEMYISRVLTRAETRGFLLA
jgi:hypothetical protein